MRITVDSVVPLESELFVLISTRASFLLASAGSLYNYKIFHLKNSHFPLVSYDGNKNNFLMKKNEKN